MSTVEPAASPRPGNAGGSVARNAALLVIAQAVGTPLSMVIYMYIGRRLGADGLGDFYQAQSFAGFGFLFVEWGLGGVIPARIAQDRSAAGRILGSALAWRSATGPIAAALLALLAAVLHRFFGFQQLGGAFQISLLIVSATTALTLLWRTCGDAIRGFERAELAAYSHVGSQFLNAVLIVPTLILTGRLHPVLLAGLASSAIVAVFVWRAIRRAGLGHLSTSVAATRQLLKEGNPFLALSIILALQPIVDTLYLSNMADAKTMGWHAAANKLVQALIMPAVSLNGALYPTLCRLHVESPAEYVRTARGAVRTSISIVLPIALGCLLYANIGIRLLNTASFGPAEDNLRMLSPFIVLVYLTMLMGAWLGAIGKQHAWSKVQFLCIVISVVGDPFLIRLFQHWHFHNGGLGVALTKVLSEVVMFLFGVWMSPRGIFDRSVLKTAGQAALAGGAMTLVWLLLRSVSPFLSAPVAVAAYGGVLFAVGGVQEEQQAMIRRKLARFRRR